MFDGGVLCEPKRPWRRHELLRVAPEFWPQVLASRPEIAAVPLLLAWAERGWPVIVRRPLRGDPPDAASVGVPLPPATGKLRIALTVPADAMRERSLPPTLWTVRHAADPAWEHTIFALVMLGTRHGVAPASFGSLLWQHLTGLPYLSPRSDLDVLWRVPRDCEIGSLLAGIAAAARVAPMRIDGEVVFPDGTAVNWRELHRAINENTPAEVLVKSIGGARLVNVTELPGSRRAA
jgi:phosphoribosyl-dephospho-CoA transferase